MKQMAVWSVYTTKQEMKVEQVTAASCFAGVLHGSMKQYGQTSWIV
jgi:hypothetical protein